MRETAFMVGFAIVAVALVGFLVVTAVFLPLPSIASVLVVACGCLLMQWGSSP